MERREGRDDICRGFWNQGIIRFVFGEGVSADALRMVSYGGSRVDLRRFDYTSLG